MIDKENNNFFLIEKINRLKTSLNNDPLQLEKIKKEMNQISEVMNIKEDAYFNTLMDPINYKGIKIPSAQPIPSCCFQLHNFATFRPSDIGTDLFLLNPYFLASESYLGKEMVATTGVHYYLFGTPSAYWFYRYPDLDGTKATTGNMNGFADNMLQTIPDVYESYRLVSACMEVRYIGAMEEASGVMACGISYIQDFPIHQRLQVKNGSFNPNGSAVITIAPNLCQYGNFEMIRDSVYFKEMNTLEGIRALYFPLDNSFNEFRKVYDGNNCTIQNALGQDDQDYPLVITPSEKTGFVWACYLQGAPTTEGRNFRIDLYCNFECLPKAELLNFIPITITYYYIPEETRQKFYKEIQKMAIKKLNNKIYIG